MNNALLQLKIKQRLNKLASLDYDNLECWMIQEAFNKAQREWVRRQVYGLNSRKEGKEQSGGVVDDLQRLLVAPKTLAYQVFSNHVEATLPKDYLYFVRTDVRAKSDCCPSRRMTVYLVEEANVSQLLNSSDKDPNFEWAETICTLVGDKLRIYTEGKFDITDVQLVYIRPARDVAFNGCIDPQTETMYTEDVTCELHEDVIEILCDETAAILAAGIENANQYQLQVQNAQRNT